MNNYNIGYTQAVQREIKKAIKRLKKSENNSERIGPGNITLDLWITSFESDLGKEICEKGKKAGYKKYLPYFTAKDEYIIFSRRSEK